MAKVDMELSSLDNSFTSKIEKEHEKAEKEQVLKPVVEARNVVRAKPSFGKKVKEAFISEDVKDVRNYILLDILVPGIKNAIIDVLERIFFDGSSSYRRRDRGRSDSGSYGRTSYTSYYRSSSRRDSRERDDTKRRSDNVNYRDLVVSTENLSPLEAEQAATEIVRQMRDYIREYDSVSVARLLDLFDLPGKYTDNNYGWTRPEDICVKRVREGYLIDVPEAEYLGD